MQSSRQTYFFSIFFSGCKQPKSIHIFVFGCKGTTKNSIGKQNTPLFMPIIYLTT